MIWNFGSINIDRFYAVPQLPGPGETVLATAHDIGLGGKGANQSVAAARAVTECVIPAVTALRDAWRRKAVEFADVVKIGLPLKQDARTVMKNIRAQSYASKIDCLENNNIEGEKDTR